MFRDGQGTRREQCVGRHGGRKHLIFAEGIRQSCDLRRCCNTFGVYLLQHVDVRKDRCHLSCHFLDFCVAQFQSRELRDMPDLVLA